MLAGPRLRRIEVITVFRNEAAQVTLGRVRPGCDLRGMRLREALDFCSVNHADEWVWLAGERPATAMAVGLVDSGDSEQPRTTILAPHSLAVYEPDARLSLTWPIPDEESPGDRSEPEWLTDDGHEWNPTRSEWAVGLARLINVFSSSVEFASFDPTSRVVSSPSPIHPVDARRGSS